MISNSVLRMKQAVQISAFLVPPHVLAYHLTLVGASPETPFFRRLQDEGYIGAMAFSLDLGKRGPLNFGMKSPVLSTSTTPRLFTICLFDRHCDYRGDGCCCCQSATCRRPHETLTNRLYAR
jgi:hypothetical protein